MERYGGAVLWSWSIGAGMYGAVVAAKGQPDLPRGIVRTQARHIVGSSTYVGTVHTDRPSSIQLQLENGGKSYLISTVSLCHSFTFTFTHYGK